MLDCLESAVRNHYIATKWNEDRYYSNIAASARAVLDFTVPDGIAVTLGKNVSPWLHTSYLLGIVPDRKSLGAIFLNAPLSDPSAGSSRESLFYGAAKALTEDMETRLGCSWTEAVAQFEQRQRGHLFAPAEPHGGKDATAQASGQTERRQKHSSRHKDPVGPANWSWEHMVALATGQTATESKPVAPGKRDADTGLDEGWEELSETPDASVRGSVALASLSDTLAGRKTVPPVSPKTRFGDVMAYGQVFQDGSVDFLYSQRLHRNWLAVAAGRSTWQIAKSHLRTQVMYTPGPGMCSELSYDSDGQVIGWSSMASFQSPFGQDNPYSRIAFGGELYYAAKERTGGLSLGFRLRQLYPQYRTNRIPIHSTFTTLVNPMMGHLSLAYVSTIRRGMDVACRYDLNLYSQESDLALGIEYAPPNSDQMMKARLCLSDGLSLLYEGRWRGAVVSLGLSLQLRGPNGAWDRSGMTATPKLGFFVTV